jgi:transcription elongation factor Elf1
MSKVYSKKYKCPVCGRPHMIEVEDGVGCYLDGVPAQSMESMMKMVALCTNCGVLYTTSKLYAHIDEPAAWRSEEYKQAVQREYRDITEKKLHLFEAIYHPMYMPLYYAHYYHEVGDMEQERKWLNIAIQHIETGEDDEEYNFDGLDFTAYHVQGMFALTPDLRLIDLCRRIGDFDKACQQIAIIKCTPEYECDNALMQYIEYQEALIADHNTEMK